MDNATLGDNCLIYPQVSIYHDCKLGNNVTIHSGSVVGADGFGFAPNAQTGQYDKIPQIGIVTIEDNVEIGANTCIDRSTMGSTFVRKGVKLDNLVQIAHNTDIGENTVMSAQVGVAGSTKVGQWCMFGGQVGCSIFPQIQPDPDWHSTNASVRLFQESGAVPKTSGNLQTAERIAERSGRTQEEVIKQQTYIITSKITSTELYTLDR